MALTPTQMQVVEENMGLVGKVIKEKVRGLGQPGVPDYDDLFQTGCIGLIKAVMTDKGGTFSTYAYRLIWNEICDALIYATRRQSREILIEDDAFLADSHTHIDLEEMEKREMTRAAVNKAKESATPFMVRCIDMLIRNSRGESCKDIGKSIGVSDKQVASYVSKARKYLKNHPAMQMAAAL